MKDERRSIGGRERNIIMEGRVRIRERDEALEVEMRAIPMLVLKKERGHEPLQP